MSFFRRKKIQHAGVFVHYAQQVEAEHIEAVMAFVEKKINQSLPYYVAHFDASPFLRPEANRSQRRAANRRRKGL